MGARQCIKRREQNGSSESNLNGQEAIIGTQPKLVYEGVEKKLMLEYSGARNVSIRKVIKEKVWRNVVHAVDAKVLSVLRGDHVDAYLLSESSLFVFSDKIYLKTCGTTRIFNSIQVIVPHISEGIPGINLTGVTYSRPTYRFPDHQLEGYAEGFEKEVELLKAVTMKATGKDWKSTIHSTGDGLMFHSATLSLKGKTVKPMVLEGCIKNKESNQENVIMDLAMFNLDQSKLKHFFGQQVNILESPCVSGFLPMDSPGLQIDDYSFEPCGYSLNALDGEYYWCIHITPEAQYSYLSFETNHHSASDIYQKLLDFYSPERSIVLWTREKFTD